MRPSLRGSARLTQRRVCSSGVAESAAAIDKAISSCIGQQHSSQVKIFLFGFSMGGHMALQMAGLCSNQMLCGRQ